MFGRKPHGDVRKSAVKVLDPKKDTVTRLKHLRVVLETYDVHEAKNFFDLNYSHIYYIFYDVFISVEADLKQRANKAHREELEMVLYIFEKILTLLPELIHKRWQYHSIGRLMKKLLHTGNSIKLRREGMRLFLIWYQILMENATEECHRTYASLVPKLGSDEGLDMDIFTVNSSSETDRVTAVEISAMLPAQSGDKQPDDMTKWLLESLLMIMVSEVNKIEWMTKEMHEFSFTFLFNKFKQYYLHNIFPDFKSTTIYDPCLDLPQARRLEDLDTSRRPLSLAMCQEAVVRWMATFTKKPDAMPLTHPSPSEKASEETDPSHHQDGEGEVKVAGSNASTLSTASSYTEKDSASSSVCSDDHTVSEYDIVKRVLYSTRENVNIVHEVFRQALLFPFNHSGAIRRVIQVYKDWLQDDHRPPFMLEPVSEDGASSASPPPPTAAAASASVPGPESAAAGPRPTTPTNPAMAHLHDNLSDAGSVGSSPSRGSFSVPEHTQQPRNGYLTTVTGTGEVTGPVQCRAGVQKVIQVFITNAANVFLLEPSEKDGLLEEQVDLCKRVLNIYRMLVINHQLDQKSWEQLLLVLLHITNGVLTETPPLHRDQSRGGRLAQPLFQTLIVTWIKANLNVYISSELWDQFLRVVSSLTQWVELVKEWAKTMETLTRVLARQVYNLDLNDLPLERQKDRKRPQRSKPQGASLADVGMSSNNPPAVHKNELVRQRSLSHEQSPSRPRRQTEVPQPMVRSSSDTNLMAMDEKKGGTFGGDHSGKGPDSRSLNEEMVTSEAMSEDAELGPNHEEVFGHSEEEYSFEGGASRYPSQSQGLTALLTIPKNKDKGDEPDRAVLMNSHFSPIKPDIIVTSPHNNNNVKKGHQSKKNTKENQGTINKVQSKSKKSKNNTKKGANQAEAEATKENAEVKQRLLDSSTSDNEGSPTSIILEPGGTEEESSTDYLSSGDMSVNVTGPEDQEVASVTASLTSTITDSTSVASVDSNSQVPYHILDRSGETSSIGGDFNSLGKGSADNKSETDVLLRISESRSPSPTGSKASNHSRSGTPVMNGSPGSGGDEGCSPQQENERSGKESPVPDRMSLHLDDMEALPQDQCGSGEVEECPEDMRSVLAGGVVVGWTADVAVILWRRMLGALGDVNQIQDPEIHARVYECMCDLLDTMLKMRDNMAVSKDNQSSPPPPELLPPVSVLMPWLFEALSRPKEFKRGKLLAYRLLCMATIRYHDLLLPMDHLTRFYRILHQGLVHTDQDTTNTLVRHCGSRFFSLPLPGSTMMILDFIHAANTIASTTDLKEAPRAEAVSILGSLICFPNHFAGEIPVLQPNAVDMTIMQCGDVKDHIISMLLKAGKKEPSSGARYIAISCVGIFLYEELTHHSLHPRLKEAINVLLAILRFNNKSVAQVAADMLMLLCDHVGTLLQDQPDVPRRIIEVIATVISTLLPSTENSNSEDDKRLLVSIMFVLLEWCMRVPLSMLLEAPGGSKSLIYKTFKVLNMVVTGTAGTLTPRGNVAHTEFIGPEEELENLRESHSNPTSPRTQLDVVQDYANKQRRSPTAQMEAGDKDILKLAAKTVMCQLVNHLGHFPMGGGAAQLNSEVQEHHDVSQLSLDELSEEIFNAPNVQFFVVNNTTLVSFVEIPALTGVPGGGVTAGLTTGKTVTRVIIRDAAGKFCWDSTVLYGPPRCRAGSYPADIDLLGREPSDSETENTEQPPVEETIDVPKPHGLPMYKHGKPTEENLDGLLEYIGQTSPECLLRPGEQLNVPDRPPEELTVTTETATCSVVLKQKERERDYYERHKNDSSMVARALEPMEDRDPSSLFQLCRLYLNQLGLMQWSKRPHFDLLKKDGKLIRELKNLDNHKCRETHKIAVIYVATGQEDKQSILTNTAGSTEYEQFVAGLGWEVDLETHSGFMGGLQRNKSTGDTAPYYATSTREVIFHVSTRMPSALPEDRHRKLRHLGNDEVQIIWSEHTRDYRRGIITTEFADVLLVIYPLPNGLFRIQINRKPEVPYFGPLFDGAIVDRAVLPGLVRATAINAGHMMRSQRTFYQAFYEERAKYVENIVQHQRETTTFEDFASQVFAPLLPHGGDMIGAFSSSDLLQMHPSHFGAGENESGKGSADKMSPQTSVKVAKGESAETSGNAFSRRLSFGKSRKSNAKQNQPNTTPPDSPNQVVKSKK